MRLPGCIAVLFLLVFGAAVPMAGAGAPVSRGAASPSFTGVAGKCATPFGAANVSGNLTVEGGAMPGPSIGNVSVTLTYDYEVDHVTSNGTASSVCVSGTQVNTTGPLGRFFLNASPPGRICTKTGCSSYRGPFSPEKLYITHRLPAGYFTDVRINGTASAVSFVKALSSVGMDPATPKVLSVLAPLNVSANPLAGDGTPSPANLSYVFSIQGAGWKIAPGHGAGREVVEAATGAGPATMKLVANGTYDGAPLAPVSTNLTLVAVATTVHDASMVRTSMDAGIPENVTVTGSGAPGYSYLARVVPGLGGSPESENCSTMAQPDGSVDVACSLPITYATTGIAQPVVNLTNGPSTSDVWTLPQVTVSNPLAIDLGSGTLVSYAGAPIELRASVVNGTGTAPFGPACLTGGPAGTVCERGSASNWTFDIAYSESGSYNVSVSVADAAGANVTANSRVLVAPPLNLTLNASGGLDWTMGSNVTVDGNLSGGLAPYDYWWNESAPSTTLATGSEPDSGALAEVVALPEVGPETVTLTVRDSLGSEIAEEVTLEASLGPATSIALRAASAWSPIVAGTPLALTFVALDRAGAVVPDFDGAITLSISGASGPDSAPFWVNASGVGSIAPGSNRSFVVPAGAWSMGEINVTLDAARSGTTTVAVSSVLPVTGVPSGGLMLRVQPDVAHLVLSDAISHLAAGGVNDTLYEIADRLGNPAPDGFVVVHLRTGTVDAAVNSTMERLGTTTTVWVNYSAGSRAATLSVVSEWGQGLLGPFLIPAIAKLAFPLLALIVALAGALAIAAAGVYVHRRGRRPPSDPSAASPPEAGETELQRLAEGRAHLLRRLAENGPSDLASLPIGWDAGAAPTEWELADWISTLVSEGLVVETVGFGGVSLFGLVASDPPVTPVKVRMDPGALEAALRRGALDSDGFEPAAGSPDG